MQTVTEATLANNGGMMLQRVRGRDGAPRYLVIEEGGRLYGYGYTPEGAIEVALKNLRRLAKDVRSLVADVVRENA